MRPHILSALAILLLAIASVGQGDRPPLHPVQAEQAEPPDDARFRHDREKALNTKRQEDLKRDTEKLLKLATELKENVDKTNENVLSLDVIKKAEEIEKLAKSVREKMKAQALEPGVAPGVAPPPPSPIPPEVH